MANTPTTAPVKAKQSIADRQWIDADGNEVEAGDEHLATGFRYVHKATGQQFEYQYDSPPGTTLTMCAIFGGLTLAGNMVNSTRDTGVDPITAVKDRFDLLDTGTWVERTGGGGLRYNPELLAQAIHAVKGSGTVAEFLAKINAKDPITVTDPATGRTQQVPYGTGAMRNPQVAAEYAKLAPKAAADLGSL